MMRIGLALLLALSSAPELLAGSFPAAVVNGRCGASFVSSRGLAITSHDCVRHALGAEALLDDGIKALSQQEERVTAYVAVSVRDVVQDEQLCSRPLTRCETISGGILRSREYRDVRLVYAPPVALADFGGLDEAWSWPRYSAAFALVRVYGSPDGEPTAHADSRNLPLASDRLRVADTPPADGAVLTALVTTRPRDDVPGPAVFEAALAGFGDKFLHAISSSSRGRRAVLLRNDFLYNELARELKKARRYAAGATYGKAERRAALAGLALRGSRLLRFAAAVALQRRHLLSGKEAERVERETASTFIGTDYAVLDTLLRESAALPDGKFASLLRLYGNVRAKSEEMLHYEALRVLTVRASLDVPDCRRDALRARCESAEVLIEFAGGIIDELAADGTLDRVRRFAMLYDDGIQIPQPMPARVSTLQVADAVVHLSRSTAAGLTARIGDASGHFVPERHQTQLKLNPPGTLTFQTTPVAGATSGTPLIDGNGHLAGITFSENLSAVPGGESRLVHVSAEYASWLLRMDGAASLIDEMNQTSRSQLATQ